MALPTSGPLSLHQIQVEFGGSNETRLSEYYAGGAYVPAGTSGTNGPVPSSGQLKISNFYGTSKASRRTIYYNILSNTENASVYLNSLPNYSAGQSDIVISVGAGVYVWSSNVSVPGLTITGGSVGDTLFVEVNGWIMGMGGLGGGLITGPSAEEPWAYYVGNGGPALSIPISATVSIATNGRIFGGGGGGGYASRACGGGGAGGGQGGAYLTSDGSNTLVYGGAGGVPGGAGANGPYETISGAPLGGGAGGGGGRLWNGIGAEESVVTAGNPTPNISNAYGHGGDVGGGGSAVINDSGSPDVGYAYGGYGGTYSTGGNGTSGTNAGKIYTDNGAGGGGGWGASGGYGQGRDINQAGNPTYNVPGGSGGNGILLNGNSVTFIGSSASKVYGAVS